MMMQALMELNCLGVLRIVKALMGGLLILLSLKPHVVNNKETLSRPPLFYF